MDIRSFLIHSKGEHFGANIWLWGAMPPLIPLSTCLALIKWQYLLLEAWSMRSSKTIIWLQPRGQRKNVCDKTGRGTDKWSAQRARHWKMIGLKWSIRAGQGRYKVMRRLGQPKKSHVSWVPGGRNRVKIIWTAQNKTDLQSFFSLNLLDKQQELTLDAEI